MHLDVGNAHLAASPPLVIGNNLSFLDIWRLFEQDISSLSSWLQLCAFNVLTTFTVVRLSDAIFRLVSVPHIFSWLFRGETKKFVMNCYEFRHSLLAEFSILRIAR